MELTREKETVHTYHFDVRNRRYEEENGTPETSLKVNFQLLEKDEEARTLSMISVLTFMIVMNSFVISGTISQVAHLKNTDIDSPKEFTENDRLTLSEPLLDMVRRLTYEVTEIAFDEPGIELEF